MAMDSFWDVRLVAPSYPPTPPPATSLSHPTPPTSASPLTPVPDPSTSPLHLLPDLLHRPPHASPRGAPQSSTFPPTPHPSPRFARTDVQ